MAKANRESKPKPRRQHVSDAVNLTVGSPDIGAPVLAQAHALKAESVTVLPPFEPVPPETHHLEAVGSTRPPKLSGQRWIKAAYERHKDRFMREGTRITDAARQLAEESKTAVDCAKAVGAGHVKNELRKYWPGPRREFKQQPKLPSGR